MGLVHLRINTKTGKRDEFGPFADQHKHRDMGVGGGGGEMSLVHLLINAKIGI